jgi:tetratricopeptide (TPR) repeat protein
MRGTADRRCGNGESPSREALPSGADTGGVDLFFSYAHEDEHHRERLEKHLTTLRNEGLVSDWHDRMIEPGEDWDTVIRARLERADVILLLLSADFISSDYCSTVEMRESLARHRANEARVIPVVVDACDWPAELARLKALPLDGTPITSWSNPEEAYLDVARGIRQAVQSIRARRAAEPAPAPVARAARKRVTVAAVDLTVVNDVEEPELVDPAFEHALRTLTELFMRHGASVSASRPDELTAVFGIPRLAEDDALRAVRASCELHDELPGLNRELEVSYGVLLAARVGVDAGTVVVDESHATSAASTAAVRGASALRRLARAGESLVGDRAYELVRHAVRVEPVLRESDDGRTLRRLIAVLPGVGARPLRPRSPLVGREWEAAMLRMTFERVIGDRTCRVVTVLGPPGIGKSRLMREFARSVGSRAVVLRGSCTESGAAYWPLLEVVRQAAAVEPTESPERVHAKIAALLEADPDAEDVAAAVAGLVDLAAPPPDADSRSRDVRRLLEAVASRVPLVIAFDDIHQAKPGFLELLRSVAEQSFGVPLLVVCLAWPELDDNHPHWDKRIPNATRIALEPLAAADVVRLIDNLLGGEVDDELRHRVGEAAEGNPLFVEELIAMLVERGLIAPDDGLWQATAELPADLFPDTIDAVVTERLDALSDAERAVARAGSVEGMRFHADAVATLVPDHLGGAVAETINALARKDLVCRDRAEFPGEDAFRFRHPVIGEVAYESIPIGQRPDLHERFAAWAEAKVGTRLAEYEETIAFHLERAYEFRSTLRQPRERLDVLGEHAGRLLFGAGRRAIARGDMTVGLSLLRRAYALLPVDDEGRAALMLDLGVALMETGDLERALEMYDAAAEAAAGTPTEWYARIQASGVRADRDTRFGTAALAREADKAERVFTALGDDLGLAKVWHRRAFVELVRCRWRAAQGGFVRARRYARRAGADRDEAVASSMLFYCLVLGPAPVDTAIRSSDRILAETRFRAVGGVGLAALGALHAMRGSFDEAHALLDQSRVILEDVGQRRRLMEASFFSATADLLAGDPRAAAERLRWAHGVATSAGQDGLAASIGAHLAEALQALGDEDEADAMALASGESAADDDLFTQIKWRAVRAKVLSGRGEVDAALALGHEAVAHAERTDDLNSHAAALADLACVLHAAGRVDDERTAREEAIRLYVQKGNRVGELRLRDRTGGDA